MKGKRFPGALTMTKIFLNKHILNASTKTQTTAASDGKNHSAVGKKLNHKTEGVFNYFFFLEIMSKVNY